MFLPTNPLLVPDFIINELRKKDDNRITGQELIKREYLRHTFEGPEDDGTKYECKPSKDGMVCGFYDLAETPNEEKVSDQLARIDEQWAQLPKVEREAETKEALKENYQAAEYFEADKTEAAANAEKKCEWVITTYPVPPYGHGSWVCPQKDVDPVTGETADAEAVGHDIHQQVPRFPFWDVAEQTIETEAAGGHFFDTAESEAAGEINTPLMNQAEAATDIVDGYPDWSELPNLFDQSATVDEQRDENVGCSYVDKVTRPGHCEEMAKKYREGLLNTDEQQNTQFDAVTGYALSNDDAASFDWFQMHHDDGIMDGYLDTVETANGDMIITEFPEFLPGQTITFEESGMDGLVAAGSVGDIDWRSWCFEQQGPCKPLDAMALNEPQNNNVF
jgi:hypothetical protein